MAETISEKIIRWYQHHHRQLPWRASRNPYHIWISEVILQQTRVEQALPYYHAFIKAFPDVHTLAAAPLKSVLKQWQGLGYYSRARHLHRAARQMVKYHQGKIPSCFEELIALDGIGPYTAAAIASIAFNQPCAVVDGNVIRVLSRLFALSLPVNSSASLTVFRQKADSLLDKKHPGLHNQAMMELGALICKPQQPRCHQCVLQSDCKAFQKKSVHRYPVKRSRSKPKNISVFYLLVKQGNKVLVKKRSEEGIWKGLYEFPAIELNGKKFLKHHRLNHYQSIAGIATASARLLPIKIKHVLSHRIIQARVLLIESCRFNFQKAKADGCRLVSIRQLTSLPMHRLMEKILEACHQLKLLSVP